MKKTRVLSLMFIGIGCAQPQNQGGRAVELDRYTNRKFLYSVGFPKGLLIPHGETPNGDGQTFESKDKKFRLVVWGEPQPDNVTAKTECERSIKVEQAKHPFKATYKAAKDDWCVFSGLIGDTIIYQKMFVDGAKSKTIRLEYPVAERIPFDSVVRRVVSSFESYRRVSAKVAEVDLANGELSFESDQPDVAECCPLPRICKFNLRDGKRFAAVQVGQTVTVVGSEHFSVLREPTREFGPITQFVYANCTLERIHRDRLRLPFR